LKQKTKLKKTKNINKKKMQNENKATKLLNEEKKKKTYLNF